MNGDLVLWDDLDFCREEQRSRLLNCCVAFLEQRNRCVSMYELHASLQQASRVFGVLVAGDVPNCCSSLNALSLVAYLALSCP